MSSEARNRVVVLHTSDACEEYPDTRCVMDVLGPYTRAEAEQVLSRQPQWTAPHLMLLRAEEA